MALDIEALAGGNLSDFEALLRRAVKPNRTYAELATRTTITTVIPIDDTIPQVGEGDQIFSQAFTPQSTTSRVRVTVVIPVSANGACNVTGALFIDGAANAVRAIGTTVSSSGFQQILKLVYEHVPGALTAKTYSVRVGPQSGSTAYINGSTTRNYGGVMAASLTIEEIQA